METEKVVHTVKSVNKNKNVIKKDDNGKHSKEKQIKSINAFNRSAVEIKHEDKKKKSVESQSKVMQGDFIDLDSSECSIDDLELSLSGLKTNDEDKENILDEVNISEKLLFKKYFKIIEKKPNQNIVTVCLTCEKEKKPVALVRGSLIASSNLIRHLRVKNMIRN